MLDSRITRLWQVFLDFFRFDPGKISLALCLMLLQGLTAGVGLLLIIPLLHLVGINFSEHIESPVANGVAGMFGRLGVELTLPLLLCLYILIVAAIASLRYQLSVLNTATQQRYIHFIRNRLYRRLLATHWQFIVENKMSDFTHSLTGQVQSIGVAVQQIVQLLSNLILALVYIGFALLLSWQMCLLALVCASILLAIVLPFNRLVYRSGHTQLTSFKSIFQMLTEQLASLKMIKSYSSEQFYADQVEQSSVLLEEQQIRITKINALTQWVFAVGTVIIFSLLFYFSLQWLDIALPSLLLLLVIFSRLLPQILTIQSTCQRLLHAVPAINDVDDMLMRCEAAQESQSASTVQTPVLNQHIGLHDVSYRYPGQDQPVFEPMNLEIQRNQTVALVGPSGSGKTTLADLIAGLLVPDSGSITCDGIELSGEQRLAWRRRVAYVTQEVFLFHQSIRDNLIWVNDQATDDDCWRVLKLAAADEFVRQLPTGLNTIIGDRGIRLSGGERQRLALARALLSNPQLLILDEATSALDHDNEQKIQQALQQLQGKLTILVIAHRETTIQHVETRVNLASG
ncbi:MAG: ABC transporter ATP-binding protein/permease [Gammaproteobacteria bacterium]|nr:ABC transporter ATP-binding protein/permease [Gammaproteobacteria bacterium]